MRPFFRFLFLLLLFPAYAPGAEERTRMQPADVRELDEILTYAMAQEDFKTTTTLRLQVDGLGEIWKLNDAVYAGTAAPDGPAMRRLFDRGIRTIISIDTPPPDFFTALASGMTYAHLPMRHGEPNSGEVMQLFRILTLADSAFYIHAAPGEERALAMAAFAAAFAERSNWGWRTMGYLAELEVPRRLTGYWAGAAGPVGMLGREQVEKAPGTVPERVAPPPLRSLMQRINEQFRVLREARAMGWQPPPVATETTPDFEADSMAAGVRSWTAAHPELDPPLREGLVEAAAAAQALAEELRREPSDPAALEERWTALQNTCAECHATHRDGAPRVPEMVP